MQTTAADWFKSEQDFHQVCMDAVTLARGENAEEFAIRILREARSHGLRTPISEKQMLWLCNLADAVLPLRRAKGLSTDCARSSER